MVIATPKYAAMSAINLCPREEVDTARLGLFTPFLIFAFFFSGFSFSPFGFAFSVASSTSSYGPIRVDSVPQHPRNTPSSCDVPGYTRPPVPIGFTSEQLHSLTEDARATQLKAYTQVPDLCSPNSHIP
jgi:hypothetical protein